MDGWQGECTCNRRTGLGDGTAAWPALGGTVGGGLPLPLGQLVEVTDATGKKQGGWIGSWYVAGARMGC